ncbi:MAG TPA: helix-turn-helix domain-containing protein, partial [Rhizobiaceae bacterium]|nr:helix-turn-helix domain-containing protein [Rhizobiaceae bacterium]
AITKHDWPGNVRELQNAIHNAVVLNDGPVLEAQMLPAWVTSSAAVHASKMRQPLTMKVPISGSGNGRHAIVPLWQMEKQAILAAIDACEGNLLKAAAALEISVSTIYRKKLEWTSASEAAE